MSTHSPLQRLVLWALAWIERYRYIKFGIVGASGTVVNLVMLHIGHEYLFAAIEASYQKPYLSLALAIAVATLNNFTWNRLWTWSDRVRTLEAVRRPAQPEVRAWSWSVRHASAFGSGCTCADLTAVWQHDYRNIRRLWRPV